MYLIQLGRKLFNYNAFSKSSSSNTKYTWKWNDSAYKLFIDGGHGHIITGNLNIVNDLRLRKLTDGYDTKFRPSPCLFVKQIMQQHMILIYLFINYQ